MHVVAERHFVLSLEANPDGPLRADANRTQVLNHVREQDPKRESNRDTGLTNTKSSGLNLRLEGKEGHFFRVPGLKMSRFESPRNRKLA